MKKKILPALAIAALLISTQSNAQKNTAFAVTGATKGNFTWNVIRQIDLSTGEVIRTVYDPAVNKSINKKLSANDGTTFVSSGSVTGSGVAAAAFDAVHNRLYFTNMRGNELKYFDFSSNDANVVVNANPAFNTGNKSDEANIITRMAFANDGRGYAVTNDGKSLLRFTTGQQPVVTNLGTLTDGKKNGTMSIHAQPTSWGGDMVGDTYGNMYLVTYRNHIFKINLQTRVADYLGQIKGLPAEFTSNGMVADDNGDVIVSSATMSDNYYKINISTLVATAIQKKEEQVFNSSDLANSNLLYQKKPETNAFLTGEIKDNNAMSVYPNPAVNKTFNVQFDKVPAGRYNMVLNDASGENIIAKSLTVSLPGQVERVSLPRTSGSGMYVIKLTGGNRNVFYSNKIIIQ